MRTLTKETPQKAAETPLPQSPQEPIQPVKVKTVEGFLAGFVKNTLGTKKASQGNYSVRMQNGVEKLIYTAYRSKYDWQKQATETVVEGEEELAVRLEGGIVLSNANHMRLCGSHVVYGGRRSYVSGQAPAQAILERAGAIPVPFRIFQHAKLELAQARVVDKAPAETITVTIEKQRHGQYSEADERRHYVGACLLEVGGDQFLFDIDREELKHKIFNPFVVLLPLACKNVEEAYLSLKPAEVLMAEMGGLPVQRQGEWFFVKRYDELPELPKPPQELMDMAENPPDARKMGAVSATQYYEPGRTHGCAFPDQELRNAYQKKVLEWEQAVEKVRDYSPQAGQLRQGESRPNRVEKFVNYEGMVLVSGIVTHSGREHRDLNLQGWWEAIPNTAVQSWQVTGEVD